LLLWQEISCLLSQARPICDLGAFDALTLLVGRQEEHPDKKAVLLQK